MRPCSPANAHICPKRPSSPCPAPARSWSWRPRLDQVPVLAVEITSSNADHDRITKRLLYAEAGVPEYWVVDPAGAVEVFDGPGLRRRAWCAGVLVSPTLADLTVDVPRLLADEA